jgi:hypothetical protein
LPRSEDPVLLILIIWLACALPILALLVDRPVRFNMRTMLILTTAIAVTIVLFKLAASVTF